VGVGGGGLGGVGGGGGLWGFGGLGLWVLGKSGWGGVVVGPGGYGWALLAYLAGGSRLLLRLHPKRSRKERYPHLRHTRFLEAKAWENLGKWDLSNQKNGLELPLGKPSRPHGGQSVEDSRSMK